jgi:hypothetical protein
MHPGVAQIPWTLADYPNTTPEFVNVGSRTGVTLAGSFLASRPDVDPERIGALGFSMSAAATIYAAANDERIKAVVIDSGWSDVRQWLKPRVRDIFLRPRTRITPISVKLIELRTPVRLRRLRPVDVVARLSPRPIFIIHVEGAGHGHTVRPGGTTSSPRVTSFFSQAQAV